MAYEIGSLVVFAVKFLNSVGADADPTVVTMRLREGIDGTELFWNFVAVSPVEGTDFPTGMTAMVKDDTGDYHVNFVARKPERLSVQWTGSGVIFQSTCATAFVRHSPIVAIDNP